MIGLAQRTCIVDGCEGVTGVKGTARGYCSKHYNRWLRNGDPLVRTRRKFLTTCTLDGCTKPHDAQGLCSAHLTNLRRHGDPTPRKRGEVRNGKKICPRCGEDLPLAAYLSASGGTSYTSCVDCERKRRYEKYRANLAGNRAYALAWQKAHPEKARTQQAKRRAQKRATAVEHVKWAVVMERDAWVCQLCGCPIDRALKWPDTGSASIDHVIPLARGGHHTYANVQAAHLGCNMSKKDRITAAAYLSATLLPARIVPLLVRDFPQQVKFLVPFASPNGHTPDAPGD